MHFAQFFIWCLSKFRCLIYKVHAPFAEQYVIIHASQEMSSVFFKVFSVCHFFQFHHLKSDLSCAQCPHSLLFHLILLKNIILSALQNLPAASLDKLAAFPKTKCSLSSIKGVLIDESNRNCQTDRRLGYNRSKVRKPWKHWCFADFVQLSRAKSEQSSLTAVSCNRNRERRQQHKTEYHREAPVLHCA